MTNLDPRRVAIIIAALRYYQNDMDDDGKLSPEVDPDGALHAIANDLGKLKALTSDEINEFIDELQNDEDVMSDLLRELADSVRGLKLFGGPGGTEAEESVQTALEGAEERLEGGGVASGPVVHKDVAGKPISKGQEMSHDGQRVTVVDLLQEGVEVRYKGNAPTEVVDGHELSAIQK